MPSLRFAPLFVALSALAGAARADEFDCNNGLAYPAAFTQVNALQIATGDTQVDSRYNHCMTIGQTGGADIHAHDGSANLVASSTVDFGLQTAHAVLDARNVVGQHGAGTVYTLQDVNRELITALVNGTTLVVTTRFTFITDRQLASAGDRNDVRGVLQITGLPGPGIDHTDSGLPAGSGDLSFSSGVLTMDAGQSATLTNWLYVDGYVNPNGLWSESPGWATLDATYEVTINVTGGAIGTASGHDYSASVVPEPGSGTLLLGGLGSLASLRALRRLRSASARSPAPSGLPAQGR